MASSNNNKANTVWIGGRANNLTVKRHILDLLDFSPEANQWWSAGETTNCPLLCRFTERVYSTWRFGDFGQRLRSCPHLDDKACRCHGDSGCYVRNALQMCVREGRHWVLLKPCQVFQVQCDLYCFTVLYQRNNMATSGQYTVYNIQCVFKFLWRKLLKSEVVLNLISTMN